MKRDVQVDCVDRDGNISHTIHIPWTTLIHPTVWLDPQEAAEISQANSRSGVRRLLKDGHM